MPDLEDEEARDFIRSRGFIVKQRAALKKHILSISRCYGLDYKGETGGKQYWTKMHLDWLDKKLKTLGSSAVNNIQLLLNQYDQMCKSIDQYDDEIKKLSEVERYKKKKEALCCFRGFHNNMRFRGSITTAFESLSMLYELCSTASAMSATHIRLAFDRMSYSFVEWSFNPQDDSRRFL